jgi:hypothetical protein
MEKYISHRFWHSVRKIDRSREDHEVSVSLARTDRARNQIVEYLIEHKDLTHLLYLDSDMVFPPDIITQLMAHQKPVVSGLYFHREPPYQPHMYNFDPKDDTKMWPILKWEEGLNKVDCTGAGALLIERWVLEEMKPPWFYYGAQLESEDITFCRRLHKAHIPVWCDTRCECGHIGEIIIGRNQFLLQQAIVEGKVPMSVLAGGETKCQSEEAKTK